MLKKLRLKFICTIMTIATLLLAVILGMVIHFAAQALEDQSLRLMQLVSAEPLHEALQSVSAEEAQLPFFTVQVGRRGELIAGGYYDLSDEDWLLEVTQAAMSAEGSMGTLEEYGLRFLKSAGPGGETIVFTDISAERAYLERIVWGCVLIGGLGMVVFFLLSLLLAHWAVKPVEQAWEQQRQFVADASHELKTPLTVIMTNAELLQSAGADDSERRHFADSILTMSRQMRGLVEGLLELARVDNGAVKASHAEFSLSTLAAEAVLPFEPVYFEQGLSLHTAIQPGIRVKGSEAHLRQVLDILLDNAAKYSDTGGRVWVKLVKQGSHCLLSVENPGPALTAAQRKDIFKRFYRVDPVRSRDGSYGLGLSIAQSIVTAHGGRIWAESENGINTFIVQLPALFDRAVAED